jgi:hypothetical protein
MSLVVVTRTREDTCWRTLVIEDELDVASVRADADDGWDVTITPYVPDDLFD